MPESVLTPGAGEHRDAGGRRARSTSAGGRRRRRGPRSSQHHPLAPSVRLNTRFPECYGVLTKWAACASSGSRRPSDRRLRDYPRSDRCRAAPACSEPAGGLYIAESAKVIARALAAGHRPRSVLVQEKWLPDAGAARSTPYRRAGVRRRAAELLEQLTGYAVHRGALAGDAPAGAARPSPSCSRDARRVVVLEDIVDHTNVGAIFRCGRRRSAPTRCWSRPRCADPLYRRSVRVSMGTVLQVPWTRLPEWPRAPHAARRRLPSPRSPSPTTVDLEEFAHPPERVALLLGAEGDGLSRARSPPPTRSRSRWARGRLAQRRRRERRGAVGVAQRLERTLGFRWRFSHASRRGDRV